ncbi:uncharacterized protein LOC134254308, partial [Saccostrea cucullata]|uniref:uncharacterized protein LOC134254308 n=1 Tax=Saccostrea cuccullata TaxID=36930 RepID=UPI002ED35664
SSSVDDALKEEVRATTKNKHSSSITVSMDGAWQKRGSGRSFESLTGHCSMVGNETGKILGYSVRNKSCKICDTAAENHQLPAPHNCKRNWTVPCKSMEPDMVVELIGKTTEKGIQIEGLVADDDTTVMSRVLDISSNIQKLSDKNHIKKNIANSLYNLKKEHSSLSSKVIKYLQKCFNYMISQNQGNPDGIEKGLSALSLHPFGNHVECNEVWCHHKRNPATSKYSSLPFGQPLKSEELQQSLEAIFNKLKKHSFKLANLGSTQRNENFNQIVASKAPKSRLYSRTIGYRVAASVAQKNLGENYLIQVNKRLGLSPGTYTRRLATQKGLAARRKRALDVTTKAKKRRLYLRAKRKQTTASKETREPVSYCSQIALDSINLKDDKAIEIPPPVLKPTPEVAEFSMENPLIYFDLESTGLARSSHITQIAAVHGNERFSTFVMPEIPMTAKAAEVTGIRIINQKMYSHGVQVSALKLSAAIDALLDFFSKFQSKVVLIGHNLKSFDCHLFLNALESCSKTEAFSHCIAGFVDTRLLFKIFDPTLKSYSQESIFKEYTLSNYNAHDAVEDVLALKTLVETVDIDICSAQFSAATFSFSSALRSHLYCLEKQKNCPSLEHLVKDRVISRSMVNKIAGSGLNYRYLQLAYYRNPSEGILNLLSEPVQNTVRVTKSQKVISSLNNHFAANIES